MGRFAATACCRELGAELKRRRIRAGISETDLAREAGWHASKVSRMESGNIGASDVDVLHYLGLCGVYLGQAKEIMALCRQAERADGYWLSSHGQHLEDSLASLIFHEATASASISYEPELMPGLLQTENYARAMIRRYRDRTEESVRFGVQARLQRQRVLHRPYPADFTFYVHERALRQMIGDVAIMQEQMLALMLLDGLPHVMVRVVPASATFGGTFRLFQFAKHEPLVYLASLAAGLFLEDPEYVDPYRTLIPIIADAALDEGQSRELIAILANEYDRGSAHNCVEEKQL